MEQRGHAYGEGRRSRRRILRDVAVGALAVGATVETARFLAAPEAADARASAGVDEAKILNFLLSLEQLEATFLERIGGDARFGAEVRQFARTAAKQDKAHADELRSLLGSAAARPSGRVQADPKDDAAFLRDALDLKEAVVAAYIGEGANLSGETITSVATIVSVEARHAAWIRSIADVIPAPRAADESEKPVAVVRKLEGAGIAKLR
jgi:hypothetical protein